MQWEIKEDVMLTRRETETLVKGLVLLSKTYAEDNSTLEEQDTLDAIKERLEYLLEEGF